MSPTRAQVLALVNSKPRGVTTQDVRRALGGGTGNVSGILSKLHAYGHIDAMPRNANGNRAVVNHRAYAYLWCRKKMEAAE